MLKLVLGKSIPQHTNCIVRSLKDSNFKKVYLMLQNLDPEIHDELTTWVEKIRNAKLCIVDCNEKWQEDDT